MNEGGIVGKKLFKLISSNRIITSFEYDKLVISYIIRALIYILGCTITIKRIS